MDEIKLKTCPFCGAEAEFIRYEDEDGDEWQVSCRHCFAATWNADSKELAAEAWNRRADNG